jgi:hypothetical protein
MTGGCHISMCADLRRSPVTGPYPSGRQQGCAAVDTRLMSRSRNRAVPALGTTGRLPGPSKAAAAFVLLTVSPIEQAFFAAGDELAEVHDFSDLDEGNRPSTLWRSVVGWLRGERRQHSE